MTGFERACIAALLMFVATICAIALGTFGFCVVYGDEIVSGRFVCDSKNRVIDLLLAGLATTASTVAAVLAMRK